MHVYDDALGQELSDKTLGHILTRQAVAVKHADWANCDSDNLCYCPFSGGWYTPEGREGNEPICRKEETIPHASTPSMATSFRGAGVGLSISSTEVKEALFNPLNAELNPIWYLLALLGAHHFLHVSRIRVKSLTLRQLMFYIYIYIYIWSTYSWCF